MQELWKSKMKQSGWSFGWSMYRTPFYHGAKFGRLGLAKSDAYVNMRINTKISINLFISQPANCPHQNPTQNIHSRMLGGPSLLIKTVLTAAKNRGTTCCRLCILGKPSKPRTCPLGRGSPRSQLRKHGMFSNHLPKDPNCLKWWSKIFQASKFWGLFVCC